MNLPANGVAFTTATSWLSRMVVVSAQFFSIKILLDALGVDNYAIYAVVMSIGGWLLLFDFGFGTALQNKISSKRVLGEDYSQIISFAFCAAATLLIIFIIAATLLSPWLAPLIMANRENIPAALIAERFNAVVIIFGFTALGGVSYKVYFAEHQGYWANIFPALGAVCGLILIKYLLPYSEYDVVVSALVLFSAPHCLISLAVFVWVLKRYWIRPTLDRGLCRDAGKFWAIAIMSAATLQLDYLIMARLLPPKDIVVYQLVTKIYAVIYFIFAAVLAAIWPVFSEMLARQNYTAVRGLVKKYVVVSACATAAFTAIFCLLRNQVVSFYFAGNGDLPELKIPFLVLVGTYNIVLLGISVYTVALQSANMARIFIVWTPVQAAISVLAQWFFASAFGIYGIIIGLLVSYVCVPLWLVPRTFYRMFPCAGVVR